MKTFNWSDKILPKIRAPKPAIKNSWRKYDFELNNILWSYALASSDIKSTCQCYYSIQNQNRLNKSFAKLFFLLFCGKNCFKLYKYGRQM